MPKEIDSQGITKISCHAHWTKESVRYNDTDRQGHVLSLIHI